MAITDPNDFASTVAWVDAQQHSAADDDPVSTATDYSGTGNDFTAVLTTRPLYKTAIYNGHPIFRFDGINDALLSSFGLPQPCTMSGVIAHRSGAVSATEVFISGNEDIPIVAAVNGSPDTYAIYAGGGSSVPHTVPLDTSFHVFVAVFNGASSKFRIDGVEVTGNPGTDGSTALMAIGAGIGIASAIESWSDIDVGEIVINNAALSAGNITDLEAYFTAHWAAAQVATPTIDPNGGSFGSPTEVTLACATAGATIYYTTDGSTPDAGDTEYTVPFTLNATATVKAIGIKAAMTDSAVASADFVITASTSQNTGALAARIIHQIFNPEEEN